MMDIAKQISQMTLREKLGQMFVVSVHGVDLEESTLQMLEEFAFGNIYLYNLNYINAATLRKYCRQLRHTIVDRTGINPLLSGTYEGGGMLRFGLYNTSIPYPDAIGKKNNLELSRLAGTLLGLQLKNLGLNFNWAPFLDITSAGSDSRLRMRSYSGDADTVANIGVEMINGMHDAGIGCAAKHFPGLGAFPLLSNKGHFVGIKDDCFLHARHIPPFEQAVSAGVDAVVLGNFIEMTNQYGYVASNSAELCSYLRNEMNYDGVITTDAIQNMQEVPGLTVEGIVNNAMASDVDMLVFGYDTRRQMQLFEQIYEKVKKNTIPISRIDRSVERILRMKNNIFAYEQAAKPTREQDKSNLLDTISNAILDIVSDDQTLSNLKMLVRGVVHIVMPYYRDKDYVGFKRSLDCCLTDVICRYAGEVHAVFYDDDGFDFWDQTIPQTSLIAVVCETFHPTGKIGKWILEMSKTNTVVCYVLSQREHVKETYPNIVLAYLHSLSDASIVAASRRLYGEIGEE